MIVTHAEYSHATNCVRVFFARRLGEPGIPCLFYVPACRSVNYVRGLVEFMRWKVAHESPEWRRLRNGWR